MPPCLSTPHTTESKQSTLPSSNNLFKTSYEHLPSSNTFVPKSLKRHNIKNESFVNKGNIFFFSNIFTILFSFLKDQPSNSVEDSLTKTQLSRIPSRPTRNLQLSLPSHNVPIKKCKNSYPTTSHVHNKKN
jgi:hypothetical protein